MKISFDLSVNDWVAFQQYYRGKKSPVYSLVAPLMIVCAILLTILNGVYVAYNGVTLMTWISSFIVLVVLYILYIRKKALESVKQAGLDIQKKNPEAFGPITMDFHDKGIDIQSIKTAKSILWHEMDHYETNKYYYFLYSKKGVVYIIPKHELSGANIINFGNELHHLFSKINTQ